MITANDLYYTVDGQPLLQQQGEFAISQNDLVCISGPSGGGKTTLLYLLSGLYQPEQGQILWGDTDICALDSDQSIDRLRTDWISLIFQEPRLAKTLSGWENIFLPLKISGRFGQMDKALLEQLLHTFFLDAEASSGATLGYEQLDSQLRRPVSTYSSGQMQRIAIIRAFMTAPKFIFADEILNSVEPQMQQHTWQALKEICMHKDIGFVLVTHNLSLLNDADFSQKFRVNQGVLQCDT